MDRICIYCGSNPGADPAYVTAAENLGRLLAAREIGVVYGGASVGMMGALADAALDAGGEVVGVVPAELDEREVAYPGVDLEVVDSMHERKQRFVELADGSSHFRADSARWRNCSRSSPGRSSASTRTPVAC